ncbi:MAG TPA: hypothetical protein ENK00_01555 [Chromatiales bacterium]|nr:hypothetical protein [Chromatiales bacterium]
MLAAPGQLALGDMHRRRGIQRQIQAIVIGRAGHHAIIQSPAQLKQPRAYGLDRQGVPFHGQGQSFPFLQQATTGRLQCMDQRLHLALADAKLLAQGRQQTGLRRLHQHPHQLVG